MPQQPTRHMACGHTALPLLSTFEPYFHVLLAVFTRSRRGSGLRNQFPAACQQMIEQLLVLHTESMWLYP
jgi:hypothetical protein